MSLAWKSIVILSAITLAACTPSADIPGAPAGSDATSKPSPTSPAATLPQASADMFSDAEIDAFIACGGDNPANSDRINLMRAYKTAPESQKRTSKSIIEAHARAMGCL